MKSFRVIYFRKYIASIIIVLTVAFVGIVAFLGSGGDVLTSSNIVRGVYYSGDQDGKNISLMINVYWGDEYVGEMLDTLKEKNVKATFFLGGTWVIKNEDLVLRMAQEGHELANHGYSHKDCDNLSVQQTKDEILKTHDVVKSLTGIEMELFMPPSGAYNEQTVEVAKEIGYKTIMWSEDTIDWRDQNAELIFERATKNASGGDLVLMHPTKETAVALKSILDFYENSEFSLVSVSKNIN